MKALILAAGLGTRLYPLTKNRPKALVEVAGKPLIEHVISRLYGSGIVEMVVNVHHHADQLEDYINTLQMPGLVIQISDERDLLLDTGGAIMHARQFLDTGVPFLVHNVDIITNIDIGKMLQAHEEHAALATLAVRNRPTSRSLLVDANQRLCGWRNHQSGETIICYNADYEELAFSGVHILSPLVFDKMKAGRFSIIDFYLEKAMESELVFCHNHDADFWLDLGKIEQIDEAEQLLRQLK